MKKNWKIMKMTQKLAKFTALNPKNEANLIKNLFKTDFLSN
jgi:hypothetical protein